MPKKIYIVLKETPSMEVSVMAAYTDEESANAAIAELENNGLTISFETFASMIDELLTHTNNDVSSINNLADNLQKLHPEYSIVDIQDAIDNYGSGADVYYLEETELIE